MAEIAELYELTLGQVAGALRQQEKRGVVQRGPRVPTLFGTATAWSLTRKGKLVLGALVRLGKILEN